MLRIKFVTIAIVLLLAPCARAADYPPGLMYSTVLNGVRLQHASGKFSLQEIQAVFLPTPNDSNYYPYNPTDGGRLWTIVRTASGDEIYRLDWYASVLKDPYWLLSNFTTTTLATGESDNSEWIDLSKPGGYVLDFYLEGKQFYTFAFSVAKLDSDDPFAGGPFYLLQGDWSDWAYFYYRDADPTQSISFKVWLNNHAHAPDRSARPELTVTRGGTVVCTSRPNMTYTLQPEWNRFEMDLISPMEGTSGGGYFKAQDLLATDSDYKLTLKLDGEVYGVWPFTVEGGKFKPAGRAVRGGGDPLTFVEGGRDAFWYKRQ